MEFSDAYVVEDKAKRPGGQCGEEVRIPVDQTTYPAHLQ